MTLIQRWIDRTWDNEETICSAHNDEEYGDTDSLSVSENGDYNSNEFSDFLIASGTAEDTSSYSVTCNR